MNKYSFCILTHKVTEALSFNIEFLSSFPHSRIFLHIDKKSTIEDFLKFESHNVTIIPERFDVKWGDFSLVEATLALLNHCPASSYCTLLSGDDFPCQSANSILEHINSLGDQSLIHFQDHRNRFVDPYTRFNFLYPGVFFKKNRNFYDKSLCFIYKKLPVVKNRDGTDFLSSRKIKLKKGTQWFTLSPLALSEILEFVELTPEYSEIFKATYCPDEMYFHTLINHLKLPVKKNIKAKNDCLRYIDWETGPDYPRSLDTSDFERIKQSGSLFARKASDSLTYDDFLSLILKDS